MLRGIVKWFSAIRGFGFIEQEDGQDDLFVHQTDIDNGTTGFRSLNEGDLVTFKIVRGHKGLSAADVRVIE